MSVILILLLFFTFKATALEISDVFNRQLNEFGWSVADCDVLTVGSDRGSFGKTNYAASNMSFLGDWTNSTFKYTVCLAAIV